jgi:hypothetical protein
VGHLKMVPSSTKISVSFASKDITFQCIFILYILFCAFSTGKHIPDYSPENHILNYTITTKNKYGTVQFYFNVAALPLFIKT